VLNQISAEKNSKRRKFFCNSFPIQKFISKKQTSEGVRMYKKS